MIRVFIGCTILAMISPRVGLAAEWMWSGALTPHSIRVRARLSPPGAEVRLAVDTAETFTAPIYSLADTVSAASDGVVDLPTSQLSADTRYFYALEVDGALDTTLIGSFRTPPLAPESFRVALGSCALTGSNHAVFNTIRSLDPLFFLHMGDFHYQNIASADPQLYRQAFQTVLASPGQSSLYRAVPLVYVWDDHDYGPNNSDSTAPGRAAVRQVYQEYVPHFPLAAGSGNVGIYQSFAMGRIKFIVTDSRSMRSPYLTVDGPTKTMLGGVQKAWLKQEMLSARDTYGLIVWVNSLPWIGATGDDGWYAYTFERKEIADFIADSGITRLCMVSGDAHMVAVDDGSHSDYSTSGGSAFPVMHAAALDQSGSVKGGPYSHGSFPGGGQFGLMQITDTGDSIIVNWSGRNHLNAELVGYRFATSGQCAVAMTGDANQSGYLSAADIITLVNYVFKSGPEPLPCIAAGDSNCNGEVTSADLITLVDTVFKGGPAPCNVCRLIPSVWTCPD